MIVGCYTSVIPDDGSVTGIDTKAFYRCYKLTSLTIPKRISYIYSDAFSECINLQYITVQDGNSTYHSNNNCLIQTSTKVLILGSSNSVIPSDGSVTTIGSSAFYKNASLTNITIPSSVTRINSSAFGQCPKLTTITIPDSVTTIGGFAFYKCSNLTTATFENPAGWKIGSTSINSDDLLNTQTAASYLTSKSGDWNRS